ncbi:MAG: RNA polymerase sigma factor FliA [Hahellaceae bacterium]|jgi:RNA polymerase sigma factor for flagellar operon FliA|nr:RNA polymerase sigma factor FliA [Hahellaceae bacterium]MCP5213274.1 RNA polymerase sigma factor FliA [Hahellaceae bacterium]
MATANGLLMYKDVRSQQSDDLVQQHAHLVKRIAQHLLARLPASVQLDDLIQSGMIGLLEAARKYDATKGAAFETYAGIRIRGSMMDEIRRGDWVPRSVHRNTRRVADAIRSVEARVGRDARDKEVADEMGISLDDYYECLQDSAGGRLFSFEDVLESGETALAADESENTPFDGLRQENFKRELASAIAALPEREKLVLSLYYDDELNLKEIGEVLSVSESRVSQIHSQAALRLRARLSQWMS